MLPKMLEFYDVKLRKKFKTTNYKIMNKKMRGRMRRVAIAKTKSGIKAFRFLPMEKRS